MENLIIIIILGIAALIGGIYLIKNYNRLDIKFFSDATQSPYTPGGRFIVITSVIVGALSGAIAIAANVFSLDIEMWALEYTTGALMVTCIGAACMQALLSYESLSKALSKCAFVTGYCIVAFIIGLIGTGIVFVAIVVYLFIMMVNIMLKSGFETQTIRTKGGLFESGEKLTQESPGSNIFRSSDGQRWVRNGDKVTRLD